MCLLRAVAAVIALLLTADQVQSYTVPEATLELLSPKGLKISIPDNDPDISLVAFHVNINEEFFSVEHGQFAQDILKKRDGRWTYAIRDFRVKPGDTIYYWTYVLVNGLGYQLLDRSYLVPHSGIPDPVTPDSNKVVDICVPTPTKRQGDRSACKGDELFQDDFQGLNLWSHEVHIGGSLLEEEFTVFTKDSDVSFVENGNLVIKPILLEKKYNDSFVNTGHLQLKECTSSVPEHCSRRGVSYLILPPVMSAQLNTRGSFSFRYGIIEVRAKLPRGDWVVPELWLQPKSGGLDRITLALSRGNVAYNTRLEAGVVLRDFSQTVDNSENTPWAQDYHTYKLTWSPDSMVFAVDNHEYGHLPIRNFNEECFITLGVHVAGSADFPDKNKPWSDSDPKKILKFWQAKDSWLPSWSENSLRVESVKVTAL